MYGKRIICTLAVCLFLCGTAVQAQGTTATILGTVSDSSGAVIPGTKITIKNTETGITRTVSADTAGRYVAPQLSPGKYEVTAEAAGFQKIVRSGFELSIGQQTNVDFALRVGTVAEEVTVTGEAPVIETSTSSVSGLVNQSQMRDLPLNARSYEQFAFLQPNVYSQHNVTNETNTGWAPKISAGGMRVGYNGYRVDGLDISDTSGLTPGSAAGGLMGVETIREYRVLTNNFPAQYGNALGVVIDAASKGGTNSLHGTAFEFLRNSAADARNFFDPASVPPFRRNQFGGVVGGPIKRDKLFFFGSYEAMRQRLTTTNNVLVPSLSAKQGILPNPSNPAQTINVPVNPAIVPYLNLYPTPQLDLGNGIGQYSFPFANQVREDYGNGRIDYQWSDKVSYFLRYTMDNADVISPKTAASVPPWADHVMSVNQTLTLAETRIIAGSLINEFRAGFVRYTPHDVLHLTGPDPTMHFPGTAGSGVITFTSGYSTGNTSIATLGVAGRPFENATGNIYEATDSVSYVKGAHSIKIGANIERFQDNVLERTMSGIYQYTGSGGSAGANYGDTYTFQSIQNLLAGQASNFTGPIVGTPVGTSGRVWLFGSYIQDDYRLRSNLTLNLGVRYEFLTPYSDRNKQFMIQNTLAGPVHPLQEKAYSGNTCSGCVDPRFGFAWDLFSNSKTVLKGGFGIFRNQLLHDKGYYNIPTERLGGTFLSAANPNFPDPTVAIPGAVLNFANSGVGNAGENVIPKIAKTPSAMQWNLTLEQRLGANTTLRLAYLGSHGYHLEGGYPLNTNTYQVLPGNIYYYPPGVHRIIPQFAGIQTVAYDFNSFYDAITVTVGRRLSKGFGFETSYAYSRATDDASAGLSWRVQLTSELRIPNGLRNTYHGLSGMDMRQRSVSNITYEFPSLRAGNGVEKKLLSGWQANGIITMQSGTPFTPWLGFDRVNIQAGTSPQEMERPNQNPAYTGSVLCPCTIPTAAGLGAANQKTPQRYYNPTAFLLPAAGFDGNLGRNSLIGPGLASFDFALVKSTALTERMHLLFRFEAFNLLNSVNWIQPSAALFQSNGSYSASAGIITATSTSSRQLQFALKLVF